MRLVYAVIAVWLCLAASSSAAETSWTVVRDPTFEVISEVSEADAQSAIAWLERLRAFFIQTGVATGDDDRKPRGPIRVILFRSDRDFAPFRPSPSIDAFFVRGINRDYIVLSSVASAKNSVLAHEYAHVVLHSLESPLPKWLAEGLAEFFSTVSISDRECTVGGDLPPARALLQRSDAMPLRTLLSIDSQARVPLQQEGVFYAETWALADMLIFSPKYSGRLMRLISEVGDAPHNADVMERVYGVPLAGIEKDLRSWVEQPHIPAPLPPVNVSAGVSRGSPLNDFSYGYMLADLNLAYGRLSDAETKFRALEQMRPKDAAVHEALASIALRGGRPDTARDEWKRALELGLDDFNLCYRYAVLAENARVPAPEIETALTKAIELKPDFDDAHYKLGMLRLDSGAYAEVVKQLRAMRRVAGPQAYAYWMAMTEALVNLNQLDDAKIAAANAQKYAMNEEQRAAASLAAYLAGADVAAQSKPTKGGKVQIVSARRRDTSNWTPSGK